MNILDVKFLVLYSILFDGVNFIFCEKRGCYVKIIKRKKYEK